MAWRRYTLRRRLSKFGDLLLQRYGHSSFYSSGQIRTTAKEFRITKDLEYIYQLFADPSDEEASKIPGIRERRQSLYRYLNPEVTEYEIETNDFAKILNLSRFAKIPGEHTTMGVNRDAFNGSTGVDGCN